MLHRSILFLLVVLASFGTVFGSVSRVDGVLEHGLSLSNFLPPSSSSSQLKQMFQVVGLWPNNFLNNSLSYAGYITVDESVGSNMFFWLFTAQDGNPDAPLLAWLNGGPGSSSLYGLFGEVGPFSVNPQGQLVRRLTSWNQHYSLLFIDNPVGTGFSYTESTSGFSTTELDVATNLYSGLAQFFTAFPEFQKRDFYLCGESYAGKYVPATASFIDQQNSKLAQYNKNNDLDVEGIVDIALKYNVSIPLAGISIGDGMMSPIDQIPGYSVLLYSVGMASANEAAYILQQEQLIVQLINENEYEQAFHVFDELMNGDFTSSPPYVANISGFSNYFNLANPVYPPNPYTQYVSSAKVKAALHVDVRRPFFDYNKTVEQYLISDWMKDVRTELLNVLNGGYRVLIYSGQYDIILNAPSTQNFLQKLPWTYNQLWNKSSKVVWKIANDPTGPAGYVISAENLHFVVMRGAGHILPMDQPFRAQDMITRFIDNKAWDA